MTVKFLFLIFSLSPLWGALDTNDYVKICKNYYVEDKFFNLFSSNVFDKNERLLICGSETPGWSSVPEGQGTYFIKRFLEKRGHFNPKIIHENNRVYFDLKDEKKVAQIEFIDAPEEFFGQKFIGVDGQTLNSKTLDKLETWSLKRLHILGYPCAKVEIKASNVTGKVVVNLKPGKRVRIEKIERTGIEGIDPRAASRFDAFSIGQFYNGILFELTSRRLLESGLANFSDFQNNCGTNESLGTFTQNLSQGRDKSLKLIVGASTQEYPILKVKWNLYRLDEMVSQNRMELHASNREQSLDEEYRWYLFHNMPRLSLIPQFKIGRYAEDFFESFRQTYAVATQYQADDSQHRYIFSVAPQFTGEKVIRGEGSEHTNFFSFETRVTMMSHFFEYYQTSPRTGYQLSSAWWGRRKGLGSSQSGDRYQLNGTVLFNWGGFDPPVFVLGARMRVEQLISEGLENTPPSMRLYLGGDSDLRGFNRKQINNGGLGFNQIYYLGVEGRFTKILPFSIQPLVFVDGAKTFAEKTRFDKLVFWSPGMGVRWASPFGALRFTAGYGSVEGNTRLQPPQVTEQWTFFVSLGQEF